MNVLKTIAGYLGGTVFVILFIAFQIVLAAAFICLLIWLFTGRLPFGWLQ